MSLVDKRHVFSNFKLHDLLKICFYFITAVFVYEFMVAMTVNLFLYCLNSGHVQVSVW